jgi:hypothetical protein
MFQLLDQNNQPWNIYQSLHLLNLVLLTEAGKYTVVAVTYNENEEVQLHNALIFDFEPATNTYL